MSAGTQVSPSLGKRIDAALVAGALAVDTWRRQKLEAEIERLFWAQVVDHPDPAITCWLWNGPMRADNYGRFFAYGREMRAHRFAYESSVGKIPRGLIPDHLCSQRRCVRHLELVTPAENTRRVYLRRLYAQRGRKLPQGFNTIIPEDSGLTNLEMWI